MNNYVIRCNSDASLFWSNEYGYVELNVCDLFSPEETKILRLPIEGEWVTLETIE